MTTTRSRPHILGRFSRIVVLVVTGLTTLGPHPASAETIQIGGWPTVYTIYERGAVGTFDYTNSTADDVALVGTICSGYAAEVQVGRVAAYATNRYAPGTQTIAVQHRLEYRTAAGGWASVPGYYAAPWQYARPRWDSIDQQWHSARFEMSFIRVPRGYQWRIVTDFRWFVGGTEVGRVLDVYGAQTYHTLGATRYTDGYGRGSCSI